MMSGSKRTWDSGDGSELNNEECSLPGTEFKQMYENILGTMISVISKLEHTYGNSREVWLSKMKRLHAVLTNSKNKVKIETLMKCKDVLKNLREKADKVPGIHEYPSPETKQGNITVSGESIKMSTARDTSQSRRTEHDSPNLQAGKCNSSYLSSANGEANPDNEELLRHKNSRPLQCMLSLNSLCNLYKCMDKKCCWTESGACNFLNHLRSVHCNKKDFEWNQCSYCPFQGDGTPNDLVQHIMKKHGHCQYQCAYCFFRGMTRSCVGLHQQSATGDGVNQLRIVNLNQPAFDDAISSPSKSAMRSIQSEIDTEESTADTNRTVPILSGEITETEIVDTTQNALFRMIESQVKEAAQDSVSLVSENDSLPKIVPLQSPKVSSSFQESNVKEEFSDRFPSREQDEKTNDDYDDSDVDENDDVHVLYYHLTVEGKHCNHVTCQGNCKLRKSQMAREAPVNNLNNCVSELIKETDIQNSSDSVIKWCPEGTAKEESGLLQEHTICGDDLVSTLKKFSAKVSIQNADSECNIDFISETSFWVDAVTTTCSTDKPQKFQAYEAPAVTEEKVIQVDQQKQFIASGLTGQDLYVCGNAHCGHRVATASQLLEHLYVCDLSREGVLECPHCFRPFKAFSRMVKHLRIHGVPRYSCALCAYRATVPTAVEKHLKHEHKVSCTETIPVNRFLNNHETDMFVISPKERGKTKHNTTVYLFKTVYRPEERHLLPKNAILNDPIQCALCSFKTTVCNNMKRHFGLHLDSHIDPVDIPTVELVNPMPCLEQKENMFDERTDLAFSSNIGVPKPTSSGTSSNSGSVLTVGSANYGQLPQHQHRIPQYVEERRRYVCSAVGCTYISCSTAMLQLHIRVLHEEEAFYRCPHCPPPAPEIPLDRMGAHLCLHGDRLYGCAHCPYLHFLQCIVERHLVEHHPGETAVIILLREKDATEAEPAMDLTPSDTTNSTNKSGMEVQDATFSQPKKRTAALRAMELLQMSMHDWSNPIPSGSPLSSPEGSDNEEPDLGKKQVYISSPEQKKNRASKELKIPCMDCGKKCINVRGLKLHIRKNHLCTAKWLCGHCYQGGPTEMSIKHHCSIRHHGLPELVKYNEAATSLILDDEFWETNYGLPPKTSTTASSPTSVHHLESASEESDSQVELAELVAAEEEQEDSQSPPLQLHKEVAEARAHCYACSKCDFVALALQVLRRHFETEHRDSEFCYIVKPSKLPSDENENVIVRTETGDTNCPSTSTTLCDAGNYVCMSCDAMSNSEEQFHSDHHSVQHPNVEPKYYFETVSHEHKRAKFECPRCYFISDNYEILKDHLEHHVKPFKCGYCAQQCDLEIEVVTHCQFYHVNCDVSVVHIRKLEVEKLKRLVIERDVADEESWCPTVPVLEEKAKQGVPRKIQTVARMSTGLSAVSARLLKKSLSAKRTEKDLNDSSESDDSSKECPYSYYGRPPSPVDENRLLAFVNYDGSVMRMGLSAFNKLYNIYPEVKVHDLKHEKLVPV